MLRLTTAVMLSLLSPLLWSAEFCSGQYDDAREMVDQTLRKYDTLYSGGDHWHAIDSVGGTLDLYRLWRNLPDWRLREPQLLSYDTYSPDTPKEVGQLLWVAEQVEDVYSAQQKIDATVGLDLAGVISVPVDAWLNYSDGDSPTWIWLQMVMSASDAPWAIAPHLMQANDPRLPAFAHLKEEAWKRYAETGGIEWAVAAQVLTPTGGENAKADDLFQRWQARVERCKATPGEYAAWAVVAPLRWALRKMSSQQLADLAQPFQMLPRASQGIAIRNLSWAALLERLPIDHWRRGAGDSGRLEAIAGLADLSSIEIAPWVNVARTYQASTLDELIGIHRDHKVDAKSVRAFNLLSAADLARLAGAPGLSPDMHKALLMTAFARHVALGNVEQATRLLPQLQKLVPERASAIERRLRQAAPQKIRLELIVLDDPQLSTWLVTEDVNAGDNAIWLRNSRPRRDLPRELASSFAIEQDLQAWLLLPQKWSRFFGMRGATLGALDRIHASPARHRPNAVMAPALFKQSPGEQDRYLEHLVAWSELPQLVEGSGLSHNISRDIVEWVNHESNTWFKRLFIDKEQMAQALSQVVRLNRGADGGMLDEVPSGKVAFTLLHRRFPDSQAARQTPYWFRWSSEAIREPWRY
jgi:hypothetical protein